MKRRTLAKKRNTLEFEEEKAEASQNEPEKIETATHVMPKAISVTINDVKTLLLLLQSNEETLYNTGLEALLEYLQSKVPNRLEFLKLGGLGPLNTLLDTPKYEVKTQVIDVLYVACFQEEIRQQVVAGELLLKTLAALSSEHPKLQISASKLVNICLELEETFEVLTKTNSISILSSNLNSTELELQCLTISIIQKIAKATGRIRFLPFFEPLAKLLKSESPQLLTLVCESLAIACERDFESRTNARKLFILPNLIALLQHESLEVKSSALSVLAVCTLDVQTASFVGENVKYDDAVGFLTNESPELRANGMKLIAHILVNSKLVSWYLYNPSAQLANKIINEHPEFINKLVELLSSSNESINLKSNVILAINNILTPNASLSSQFTALGAMKPIVNILSSGIEVGDNTMQERCTLALALFSKTEASRLIHKEGAFPLLISQFSETGDLRRYSIITIANCSNGASAQARADISKEAISTYINIIGDENSDLLLVEKSLEVLNVVCQDQERHPSLIELGLLRALVGKLHLRTHGLANRAIWIIHQITKGTFFASLKVEVADENALTQVSRIAFNKLLKLQNSKDVFVARTATACVQKLNFSQA